MEHAELAELLVEAGSAKRKALLREHCALADIHLAYTLKEMCQDAWRTDPSRSIQAADVLTSLTEQNNEPEISGLMNWVGGIAALLEGQMELAVSRLDAAEATLLSLHKDHTAAETQLAKTIALAMLGRYEEAIECGLRAREVFLAHNDQMEAGRIENNIGNLYFRRDRYHEAEKFQSIARERFVILNNQEQLAIINNCLANTHALLHRFDSAEGLYKEAVQQAETAGLHVTLAEIEGNIGNFTLLQGRYDHALDYLERSRRRYASLGMSHQSAIAEQEIADAYLELNLAPEAAVIYERVAPKFAELGMRAEEARALAFNARAAIILGQIDKAHVLLDKAVELYVAEGNNAGVALVKLTEAQLFYAQHNCAAAYESTAAAEPAFVAAGATRRLMFTRWLHGEAARCNGARDEALSVLEATLNRAESEGQPDIAARCLTSLGLAAKSSDRATAERSFKRAVKLIEALRAPLPAEEFRTAFFSDKLVPYNELVRLCLEENRISEALGFVEGARSRALADSVGGNLKGETEAKDEFEADLLRQTEALREELNYLYNQLNRSSGEKQRNKTDATNLQQDLRERESKLLEITRQLQHRRHGSATQAESFALEELQSYLGADTALVEYTSVGEELIAFVVTDKDVQVVRSLAIESEVAEEVAQFRFQIDTLRYGAASVRKHLPTLTQRVRKHLQSLYDQSLRGIEANLGARRLVIVPHRALHYLPFQALHDGESYLIERREVTYAPSALVLQQCLSRPKRQLNNALLLGVTDEHIPLVRDEIKAITRIFPTALSFLDDSATVQALTEHAPAADIVHLACHAQFRSDNPLFSSLRLGNGWFTVRDARSLKLNCALVTLSACETGVNVVAPGEELIGLARSFFSAGSPAVLLSLWTVDDEATAGLMVSFYSELKRSNSPATALRAAQIKMLREKPHPFFWSPFAVVGRG
jgi:CHAT domain-containing protein